jgi:hypothetical protein
MAGLKNLLNDRNGKERRRERYREPLFSPLFWWLIRLERRSVLLEK